MISVNKGYKIFDKIFHYPRSTPEEAILIDPMRLAITKYLNYDLTRLESGFIFIYPSGVKEKFTFELIRANQKKKIIFVFSGENMFGYSKLISHVYSFLKKLNLPTNLIDKILFNKIGRNILSIYSPYQVDTYFKNIVKKEQVNHFFILTNALQTQNPRIFFSPYFYFFCQDRLRKISHLLFHPERKKFCSFIVSNPNNTDRIEFFQKLSLYQPIDSFGKILNNKSTSDVNDDHIIFDAQRNDKLYQAYKFVICFENSYADGYITEKLINAIAGGAIPIYRGAKDLKKYFNVNRIINFDDYDMSYDKMIQKIIALDQDDSLYYGFMNQPVFQSPDIEAEIKKHEFNFKKFLEFVTK